MNIILVFPKQETAKCLKNVLRRAGYTVDASVTTVAQALQAGDLLSTMEVMSCAYSRWRKKMRAKPRARSEEEQKTIDRAKVLLMERNGLTEAEAHRYIQKSSMDNGTSAVETADMILELMNG